jgi:hypothetical protein
LTDDSFKLRRGFTEEYRSEKSDMDETFEEFDGIEKLVRRLILIG